LDQVFEKGEKENIDLSSGVYELLVGIEMGLMFSK